MMMPAKPIWCPNVILLDKNDPSTFSTEQVIEAIHLLPPDIPFLFLAIGDFKDSSLDSQIIIQQHGYSIYKENIFKRGNLTSLILETGLHHVYYIHTEPDLIKLAFIHFMDIIGSDYPIICLAPHLSGKLEPAIIIEPSEKVEPRTKKSKAMITLNEVKNISIKFNNQQLWVSIK
ncbi:MAG: hypothetical protein A2W97_10325 [Bacteroidetes bacterium GWE2_40_63]|nr:MAG: hypothetical protein A2W84_00285 [Bacteroidetes bacterium GWC2_40_13]OFX71164.1 MAG: hypothetical protein A2W96_15630 [Bacteroidetes bacterium GWD2_40_43]OFX92353.1 MAG: hypothetical protein A2W97_10325 [Bacteroidetes bacterium GWE2_40_63]OFY22956.1 MAG: hypothetical protein A2W88_04310 [Bacteroidetes bacterium GWF2_40_13]OFZ29954.1 MAG: hypothetical protein A2437_00660 [Bacteroidetes bacterium RIFOXYC2_FULL_40_12]HAZ01884.1 hypothetical protein [Marinilabiliales bacterium]